MVCVGLTLRQSVRRQVGVVLNLTGLLIETDSVTLF